MLRFVRQFGHRGFFKSLEIIEISSRRLLQLVPYIIACGNVWLQGDLADLADLAGHDQP